MVHVNLIQVLIFFNFFLILSIKLWLIKLYILIVPATIEALPEIVEAVGNQLTVMIDGGIRNGMSDRPSIFSFSILVCFQ